MRKQNYVHNETKKLFSPRNSLSRSQWGYRSPSLRSFPSISFITANMISDGDLYRLAIFFGTTAMILIVLYHFLEVNAAKDPIEAGKEGASKSL
ncbi:hypothetical protein Forpi1262_v007946 [Fusarium oxysporum f. sp. raphani]|uniref:Oligosaccaryltransferase n=1 Tax=Fusarium oxysporum f. sp. raphani TaxID=96318 RepID=A0A8J5U7B2_FUSOX|nr:hypothetical protein Forpi1262_v007946 [Fusarium oxysporum f. sp. raphani]